MPNTSPSNPPRLLLFLDWDGTLTPQSTLPLIASIPTSPAPHPHPYPHLAALSAAYAHDLTTHDETYTPPKRDRTTVPQELAYLDSLRPVERASIERVEAAGLFRGVGAREVDRVAKAVVVDGAVRLREGVAELVRKVGGRGGGGGVAVVSVAWSRRFIRGVLGGVMRSYYDDDDGGGGGWGSTTDRDRVLVEGVVVDVRANEIAGGGSGMLDRVFGSSSRGGEDGGGIWTAGDKVRVMNDIVLEAEKENGNEAIVPKTIYIGDSPTDLACLLQAHVGICIRDAVSLSAEQRDLQETLERIGVPCLHIGCFEQERRFEIDEQMQQHVGATTRLWWAGDFEEVWRSGVLE